MPRMCQIKGCKKTAKLKCDATTPTTYLCQVKDDAHEEKRNGLSFQKLVNSPCNTCVSMDVENIKEATFGPMVDGKLKRMYCKEHSDMHENITGKKSLRRCEHEGCETEPAFCAAGETVRKFCRKHKPDDAVHNIIASGKSCRHEFQDKSRCMVQPLFGFPDDKRPTYCKQHRLNGMKNIVDRNRGCEIDDCTISRAVFGLPNSTKATRCAAHRTNEMSDIVNTKCLGCGLFVVTSQKNHRCYYCSDKTACKRKNELSVFSTLKEKFPDYPFTWNCAFPQDISCALAKYRPDFTFDCGSYYLIVECDEDAHRQYDVSCERKRMYEIVGGLGLPVVFVCYNPDSFSINGILSQCHHVTKKRHLVNTVQKYLTISLDDMFKRSTIIVHYLFYDIMQDSYERIIGLEENNGTVNEIEL